ncbi:MAG: NINE protein [Acidimicrobiia bacterium]|nr:NINE protein [Acidimicrobiia bacterium]
MSDEGSSNPSWGAAPGPADPASNPPGWSSTPPADPGGSPWGSQPPASPGWGAPAPSQPPGGYESPPTSYAPGQPPSPSQPGYPGSPEAYAQQPPQGAYYGPAPVHGPAVPQYGYGAPTGLKSRTTAGILGILLGGLGVHRFYLGYTAIGIAQIVLTIVTCGAASLWGLIEGILILVKNDNFLTDAEGRPLAD